MTRHPIDLPDPEPTGPTIWAAREIRPVDRGHEVDSYRGYRAEYPTAGQTFLTLAVIIAIAAFGIAVLVGWALA